jgi:hypothetical protein
MKWKQGAIASTVATAGLSLALLAAGNVQAATRTQSNYAETAIPAIRTQASASTNNLAPNAVITGGGAPSCQSFYESGTYGFSYFTSQVSSTPSFMWSYHVTASGAEAVNGAADGDVTVSVTSGNVLSAYDGQNHTLKPGGFYSPHTEAWDYTFHGGVSKWPLMNGSFIPVRNGDIVTLYFETDGLFGSFYDGPITCQVEQ